MKSRLVTLFILFAFLVPMLAATVPTRAASPGEVIISEIRTDQTSTDYDEYFELAGAPDTSLDGLYYLVIGDGTGGSGVIEEVTNLTGFTIPASGFFVAAEDTFTLGTADLSTDLNFENSDNVTHLLVSDFIGSDDQDLDTNDDGILDVTPWSTLIDLIALVEEENPPSGTEYHYGPPSIGPDGSYVPGHVFLCDDGWQIGLFDLSGGDDTPGAANDCVIPPPEVAINEIRIDQPSDDFDEYFELAGTPGTSLEGLTYLVIGDGTGGSGVIENVTDLAGQTIPSSGYFVAAESSFTLGITDLVTNLNFENSDNVTHMLVSGFSGADGDDLDTNDDGILDVTPWGTLIDLIALVEEENPPSGTEYHYGPPSVGPDGSYVPGHAFFCPNGWQIGSFDPVGGDDTPGATNNCVIPPPEVAINEIRIDQPDTDYDEYFELAGTPGTSLDGLTYLVIGDGTGGSGVIEEVTNLTGQTIPASGFFVAAEGTFNLGTADLSTDLNFENSDNVTHLLVSGFSGANGDDLDTNDDGVLDITPWTTLVDLIALVEEENPPSGTEYHYGPPSVGPDGSYVPGHAILCDDGWQIGSFDPADGVDTPGEVNKCVSLVISEIRIDQEGTDYDEYFELAGKPGKSLDGLTYIVIGDGTGGSGVIEEIIDLTGQVIPESGFFVAAESTFSLGSADLTTNLNFENSDNVTHLLVKGFSGSDGEDLDTNDDGVLDITPWNTLIDLIALVEEENPPSTTEYHYGPPSVGPDGSYVPGHAFLCDDGWWIGDFNLDVNDTPGAANNCEISAMCGYTANYIHDVQGSGASSPLSGASGVVLEGVVVGDFQTSDYLRGFFLQEEDADHDGDPNTSEGIFVYDGSNPEEDVNVGEVVRVRGSVTEYFELTELTDVTAIAVCGTGTSTATAAVVNLPVASLDFWEQHEGMLVTFPDTLFVTDNYDQGHYGEVSLSVNGRLYNPTSVVMPGEDAIALQDLNDRSRIQLDDGSNVENPLPLPPYIGLENTLRTGDTITDLTAVLSYAYGDYELHPPESVEFTRENGRPDTPDTVGGVIKVASFNVLNYFTTIDNGLPVCGPSENMDCRGADSPEEFERQRAKIITAITTLDADVVGLMEIENNIYDEAVIDLVNGLNEVAGVGTYDYIATGTIGTDAIKVALIYKPASVAPLGAYAILDSSVDPTFIDTLNRPALAQTFQHLTGEVFTVVVNHLKSKGSDCDDYNDPDTGDGQGNCNLTRTAAATALANWLDDDPTGSEDPDFLIIGDLNSYAMEDPIDALKAGGYTNLIEAQIGWDAYSYVYFGQSGYLDHALANNSLVSRVEGVTIWHINADEPSALDYNDYNQPDLYQPDQYRSSDHDPVLVGICDSISPEVEISLTHDTLWPANHKYVTVHAKVDAYDLSGDTTIELLSVSSNEPDDGLGDGDTSNDIVIMNDFTFKLRAERAGGGEGRIYTITYAVTDPCGNMTIAYAYVTVPLSQGN